MTDPAETVETRQEFWQGNQKLFRIVLLVAMAGTVLVGIFGYTQTQEIMNNIYSVKPALQSKPWLEDAVHRINPSDTQQALIVYTALEIDTVISRYNHAASLLVTKAWVRLLATMAAAILILFGAAFVLGHITTAPAQFAVNAGYFKGSLATTSPGLVLVVLGVTLLALTLYAPWKLETRDGAIYGPFTITHNVDGSSAISMAAPPPVAATQTNIVSSKEQVSDEIAKCQANPSTCGIDVRPGETEDRNRVNPPDMSLGTGNRSGNTPPRIFSGAGNSSWAIPPGGFSGLEGATPKIDLQNIAPTREELWQHRQNIDRMWDFFNKTNTDKYSVPLDNTPGAPSLPIK